MVDCALRIGCGVVAEGAGIGFCGAYSAAIALGSGLPREIIQVWIRMTQTAVIVMD